METRTLNLASDIYPVVTEVVKLAEKDRRSLSQMAGILLEEAVSHREAQQSQRDRLDVGWNLEEGEWIRHF